MNHLLNNVDYSTDEKYMRVIPRDLFNEAKLLKCIGRLVLDIHDRKSPGVELEQPVSHTGAEYSGYPFRIGLMDDGYLVVTNLAFLCGGKYLLFRTEYNSKKNYPLVCTWDYCDIQVFEESGEYTEEFREFCQSLTVLV